MVLYVYSNVSAQYECMLALYLVAKHRTTTGIVCMLLASITRTVIWLFKVIDMCTPWSLETRPRSKILAKTLRALHVL